MAKNTGKPSESAFLRLRTADGSRAERIFDAGALWGLNKGGVADFPRPADFIVFTPQGLELAEVKSSANSTSFPFAQIEKGQRKAAALASLVGCGKSYVFYLHSLHLNLWFSMDADQFVTTIKGGDKSIKWSALTEWSMQ